MTFPENRTAIVTGAASQRGIGRATAHLLASRGWAIAIWDLDPEASGRAAEEVAQRHGIAATGWGVDITDEAAVDHAATEVERTLPPVVGVVNNAAISSPTPFLEVTTAEWDRVFEVNVRGVFLVLHRLAPGLVDRGVGRIVNISSVSGQTGGAFYSLTAYSGTKAALLGITRTLARELGPHGVTVNAVAPGLIDTDIMGGTLSERRKAEIRTQNPLGRVGSTEDVAEQIAFLLSDAAKFITGTTANVNGGVFIA